MFTKLILKRERNQWKNSESNVSGEHIFLKLSTTWLTINCEIFWKVLWSWSWKGKQWWGWLSFHSTMFKLSYKQKVRSLNNQITSGASNINKDIVPNCCGTWKFFSFFFSFSSFLDSFIMERKRAWEKQTQTFWYDKVIMPLSFSKRRFDYFHAFLQVQLVQSKPDKMKTKLFLSLFWIFLRV